MSKGIFLKGTAAAVAAAFALSGCFGGSSGTAASAGSTSVTLTPVKGIFTGSCHITVKDSAGNSLINQDMALSASGTVSTSIPVGAVGPFVISVSDDAAHTCKYFNDNTAAPAYVPMASGVLNALVPTAQMTAASGVSVTSITDMAFQAASAAKGGVLTGMTDTDPAIAAGITSALNLLGMSGASGASAFFQPPAQIPQSGVVNVTDAVALKLISIANMNQNDPMAAVRAVGLRAAAAALGGTNASATALIAQAGAIEGAASFVSVGQGAAFLNALKASAVAAASASMNASATQSFLSDFTSADGLRRMDFGVAWPNGGGQQAIGQVIKATLTNAVYTVARTVAKLVGSTWTPITASNNYVLTANGWTDILNTNLSFSLNLADGTAKLTEDGYGTYPFMIAKKDLSGITFASAVANQNSKLGYMLAGISSTGQVVVNASGIPVAASNPVPAGSFASPAAGYDHMPAPGAVASQDIYEMPYNASNFSNGIDMGAAYSVGAGVSALTALPAAGASFCVGGFQLAPTATAGTYNVYGILMNGANQLATQAAPCPALPAGFAPQGQVTVTQSTVNGVTMDVVTSSTAPGMTPQVNSFIAVINGAVRSGTKTPAGAPVPLKNKGTSFNKSAVQQFMTAIGMSAF